MCNPQIIRLNGGHSCPSRINAIIVGNKDNHRSGSTNFTNLLLITVSPTPQTAFITRGSKRVLAASDLKRVKLEAECLAALESVNRLGSVRPTELLARTSLWCSAGVAKRRCRGTGCSAPVPRTRTCPPRPPGAPATAPGAGGRRGALPWHRQRDGGLAGAWRDRR